ncbi:MAG: septum formation initiator family protein [Niabella sp.]
MEEFVDFVAEKEPDITQQPPQKRRALNRISRFLTNKFFVTTVAFVAVMFFLDKNDIITTIERRKEMNDLSQSIDHYTQELSELRKIKDNLESDPVVIEKLAREKYLMKRENEDVFLTEDGNGEKSAGKN